MEDESVHGADDRAKAFDLCVDSSKRSSSLLDGGIILKLSLPSMVRLQPSQYICPEEWPRLSTLPDKIDSRATILVPIRVRSELACLKTFCRMALTSKGVLSGVECGDQRDPEDVVLRRTPSTLAKTEFLVVVLLEISILILAALFEADSAVSPLTMTAREVMEPPAMLVTSHSV